jgi:hypothetical protein
MRLPLQPFCMVQESRENFPSLICFISREKKVSKKLCVYPLFAHISRTGE